MDEKRAVTEEDRIRLSFNDPANELQKFVIRADASRLAGFEPMLNKQIEENEQAYSSMLEVERQKALSSAAQDGSSKMDDLLRNSKIFLKYGHHADARRLAQAVLSSAPGNVDAALVIGRTHLIEDRPQLAMESCKHLVGHPLETAEQYLNLGHIFRASGDWTTATSLYKDASRLAKTYAERKSARLDLGFALLATRRVEEAIHLFESESQKDMPFADALVSTMFHELEQVTYLLQHRRIDTRYENYVAVLRRIFDEFVVPGKRLKDITLSDADRATLDECFGQDLMFTATCEPLATPAVNPDLDTRHIEREYNEKGMVAVDDFLMPEALERLRRYCLEARIWRVPFVWGYVGAFPEDGFCPPLLLQVAQELRERLPGILGDLPLVRFWGFKYDQRLLGIKTHADPARVNVNFWLTPDSANSNPDTGGLIVWDKRAPRDWSHDEYNTNGVRMRQFLHDSGAKSHGFPYRQNRVVLFDSDFFHETQQLTFKSGYENRRTNMTLLYGEGRGLRHFS